MQTSLWNFLKQETTHKLVLRGMFHTCSEFLFLSHDDYSVIIIIIIIIKPIFFDTVWLFLPRLFNFSVKITMA